MFIKYYIIIFVKLSITFGILHQPKEVTCTSLYIFGDGLSDDGAEDDIFSYGFQRNSNGPIWCEYLRIKLNCKYYVNYAFSGAKSGMDNFYFKNWSGIHWQIGKFRDDRHKLDKGSVIILQTGGIIDLLSGEVEHSEIIKNLKKSLEELTNYLREGKIIIMNLFDLSLAPGLITNGGEKEVNEDLTVSIASLNQKIRTLAMKTTLNSKINQHIDIRIFDLNSSSFKFISNLNTTKPFNYQSLVTTPLSAHEYAYYDSWHPTTIVHSGIASDLIEFLEDH
ncbi:Lipase, GDSL domain and SGNH hydrolase-type esterase domain-containing protein [Strongyloides ratti]|uniref:Lipase, GDSL domain and SGNH hydrolase-type esterase domain-containing protein n=1 Tax=Strongyloides ratti TaxID=34506 RepID=A0A090MZG5_STRRB|nr:Lipase, GDSL domain and SGNH hydrolase-type esterase domain-containing protein [Strongyloides ratti]CEF68894.1 Lipase, GDSL domain and SGNH hydrolase-type esterase domain-containing protein [Strongyloides ratti]